MNNHIPKSILLGAAALLSFACQEVIEIDTPVEEGAIKFTSDINTKATDLSFEVGDEIGVTAFTDTELASIYADN
ncbi:MAG: fimbrillin family protein, partial [Rikenellaceae bacterium]